VKFPASKWLVEINKIITLVPVYLMVETIQSGIKMYCSHVTTLLGRRKYATGLS